VRNFFVKLLVFTEYINIEKWEASAEESEEILTAIEKMSDDDLTIASVKHFSV
jgi:hypothetical protein